MMIKNHEIAKDYYLNIAFINGFINMYLIVILSYIILGIKESFLIKLKTIKRIIYIKNGIIYLILKLFLL